MPRSEGRIRAIVWSDPDFLALSMDAKCVYMMLLSQPDMTHAGTIRIPRREWAGLFPADDDAADRIAHARKELEERRFTVTDDDADLLLIRGFLRWEIETANSGTFCAGMEAVMAVGSALLRAVLRREMRRMDVGRIDAKRPGNRQQVPGVLYRRALDALGPDPDDPDDDTLPPPPPPSPEPSDTDDDPADSSADRPVTRHVTAAPTGLSHDVSHGPVAVAVDMAVEPSRGEDFGGCTRATPAQAHTPAHARDADPPCDGCARSPRGRCRRCRRRDGDPPDAAGRNPTALPAVSSPNPCGGSHDPATRCGACGTARRATAAAATAEADRRRAVDAACPYVDWHSPTGRIEDPDTGADLGRCDHRTDPRFLIARARGETA